MSKQFIRLCAVAFLNILTFTNSPSLFAAQPNVLFLLSDDQRPDTIHALGNDFIQTPNLDKLVHAGSAFTRATCGNPICTPSRAEIMSGANSLRNGVLDFGRKINPEMSLWAKTMQTAGYRTAYVGKWHNDGRPGQRGYAETDGLYAGGGGKWAVPSYDWNGRLVTGYRGWIFQQDGPDFTARQRKYFPEKGIGLTPNISENFADSAIRLIEKKDDKPFFIHVNFPASHDPLLMPFGYEGMYDPNKIPVPRNFLADHPFDHGNYKGRDEVLFEWPRTKKMVRDELTVYYAVISHMDAQIGKIVTALKQTGQYENTIVIFASDHGLGVGSHGLRGKQSMYDHTIGVPLVMSGPGIPSDKQFNAQCYLRDLFPTVCTLCGINVPKSVDGKSLKPVLDGKSNAVRDHVFGYFRNFQRMIRTDEWKLIYYPHLDRTQLFNLKADPDELKDLAGDEQYAEVREKLRKKLISWQKEHNDPALKTEK